MIEPLRVETDLAARVSVDIRRDPLSGRTVVVAPNRARRPGVGGARIEDETPEELDACPFCEGREDRTPPETLALGRRDGATVDSPGWQLRVVPNLYPAFERQEVVIHSPQHVRSFADLSDVEVRLVAEAWSLRAVAAKEGGFPYVHALVNEGRLAGASLAHSHSQLVWMREAPPAVVAEAEAEGAISDVLRQAHRQRDAELHVDVVQDVVAVCPPASRVPYEVLITNGYLRVADAFSSEDLPNALLVLRNVVRRLRAVEGPVPWNAWLHTGRGWHIELVPRLTIFAGIELGAGIYVNTLAPEDAAAALRAAGQ